MEVANQSGLYVMSDFVHMQHLVTSHPELVSLYFFFTLFLDVTIFLREVIAKFFSSLLFLLSYLSIYKMGSGFNFLSVLVDLYLCK